MKRLFYVLLLVLLTQAVQAQTQAQTQAKAQAQTEQQQYDSIMVIMKNKSVPLMERYYMTGNIENLSRDHQITVLKQLVPEAKAIEDKAVITRLYSIISMFETQQSRLEIAKQYLDSAFAYEGKFANNTITGMMYYVAGIYYSYRNEMVQAHSNYYKSAQYFNMNEQKPGLLTEIYYNLSSIYVYWQDENGMMELMQKMKDIPVDFPDQQILKLSVRAQYYYIRYKNTLQKELLDSVGMYNNQAIDIYKRSESPYDVGYQVSENYFLQALVDCEQGEVQKASKCLDAAKKLVNPDKLDVDAQILFISGVVLYHQGEYQQAEKEMIKGLDLLLKLSKVQQVTYYHLIVSCYSVLAQVYENQHRYGEALEAERRALDYQSILFERKNSQDISNLRVKYDLGQKEQSIKQLSALNEQSKRINRLAAVIICLALILIFMLVVRYRIRQKQSVQLLEIARLKQHETDLTVELQKTKLEERDREFQAIVSEVQQRRIQSYLEGLEAERNRLAKELHDNVSNELLAIKMKIEEETSTKSEILNVLQTLHTDVRAISHDLMPPAFTYATLAEILQDYVGQHCKLDGTTLSLSIQPEAGWELLPQKTGLEIYRIVQEATGNALKYAGANKIAITLLRREHQVSVVIADDGCGFDPNKQSKGIGMKIIRERAESLKGKLTIDTVSGKGTKITLIIDY